jgi:hypothetical protein
MNLPPPRFQIAPIAKNLERVRGFSSLQTYFPTLGKLFRITKHQSKQIWLDSPYRIVGLDISGTSGACEVELINNTEEENPPGFKRPAFLKVTHLLDPIRWMKGEYSLPQQAGLPGHSKTWSSASTKLQDVANQAYVECVASYALGRIRDAGISPHFNEFYGGFCATADIYRYNLTEEFQSFRNTRWFWHGQKRGLYSLHVSDAKVSGRSVSPRILDDILREPSELNSDSDAGDDESFEEEEVEMEALDDEEASLHSDEMSDLSFAEERDINKSSDDTSDSSAVEDNYTIYSEISKFPVMMLGLEKNEGTMDALLDDYSLVGCAPDSPEWELHWSAWVFQVLAALSVAQSLIGFTHNDLHTNNIVWITTQDEFLYYTKQSGEVFKVPTYGKIFRIIDFGRAIFTINSQLFFSDDFKAGNDADGQYCFKPLHPRPVVDVPPNPSFDLSRLAVSLFDSLFPDHPPPKEGGMELSSEPGLSVEETISPLYNVLWSWMIDDDGRNVLVDPTGEERFPDFDLYKHIAANVHGAIPSQQFSNPAFDRFQVASSEIGDVKRWSLFC